MRIGLLLMLLTVLCIPTLAQDKPRAKFEPPDGSVYHGVCLSDVWDEPKFDANVVKYKSTISEGPLVLHSWFAHSLERGKWRTWEWQATTPDVRGAIGGGKSYSELSRKHGMVPLIAWTWMDYFDMENSPLVQDVTAGKYDWYLDDWIKGIREFKDPMFIRLSHEMDGDWYPYSEGYKPKPTRNTAADYVAYYKYIVDRFRAAGVTNVAWVWCVNGDRSGGKDWPDYYPGDEYVDWLAIDPYSLCNPSEMLGQFVEMYGKTGKPIMIPEGGTGPEQTKWNTKFVSNAAWVTELFDTVEKYPQVKAICWFEYGSEWELARDPEQLAVFKKRIDNPRYKTVFVP